MSKGSHRRPRQISDEEWRDNFARIFGSDELLEPVTSGQKPVVEGDDSESTEAD